MARKSASQFSRAVRSAGICGWQNHSINRRSSSYRQTIQRAFGDVSDALIGYQKYHEVRLRQEESVADLQESVRISTLRYRGGTTTYLGVLDGQRSLYDAELTTSAGAR